MRFYAVTCSKDNLRSMLILAGDTQRDMLTHRQTHQYHDSAWSRGRAEWKLLGYLQKSTLRSGPLLTITTLDLIADLIILDLKDNLWTSAKKKNWPVLSIIYCLLNSIYCLIYTWNCKIFHFLCVLPLYYLLHRNDKSDLWADAFYKSKCPYICLSVCQCVHFWGTV